MAMVKMAKVEPLEDVTHLLDEIGALQVRAEEDGLLFFRGLLDPYVVTNVRTQILEVCGKHGWIAEATAI
mgnify:FL=1